MTVVCGAEVTLGTETGILHVVTTRFAQKSFYVLINVRSKGYKIKNFHHYCKFWNLQGSI